MLPCQPSLRRAECFDSAADGVLVLYRVCSAAEEKAAREAAAYEARQAADTAARKAAQQQAAQRTAQNLQQQVCRDWLAFVLWCSGRYPGYAMHKHQLAVPPNTCLFSATQNFAQGRIRVDAASLCTAVQMAEKQALRQAAAVQKLADAAAAALAKQQLEDTLKAEKVQRKTAKQQQLQQQKQEVRVKNGAGSCLFALSRHQQEASCTAALTRYIYAAPESLGCLDLVSAALLDNAMRRARLTVCDCCSCLCFCLCCAVD